MGAVNLFRGRSALQIGMKPTVAYCRSANEPPDGSSPVRSQVDARPKRTPRTRNPCACPRGLLTIFLLTSASLIAEANCA
jgi:hypothetical protein